jgi:hypothetical protein
MVSGLPAVSWAGCGVREVGQDPVDQGQVFLAGADQQLGGTVPDRPDPHAPARGRCGPATVGRVVVHPQRLPLDHCPPGPR